MKIKTKKFCVSLEKKVKLEDWATSVAPFYETKKQYEEMLREQVKEMSMLQKLHYASNSCALLLIFQGMDASGKDGAIRHVMSGINPQGCQVHSFKQPSVEELQHDFLWRTNSHLPERGHIGIFNRSYYEEVLVVKVHSELLLKQGFNEELRNDKKFWEKRYRSIRNMEEHLHSNNTHIIKFYLHLSKKEQRKRFMERLENPNKNWKLSLADGNERKYWDQYKKAYEDCLNATATPQTPWYIIPADDKENARLIISQTILEEFSGLRMVYPKIDAVRQKELNVLRQQLTEF